jgi:serine/threonine-protein kinase MRCK
MTTVPTNPEAKLRDLEQYCLQSLSKSSVWRSSGLVEPVGFSVETLLDILLILYDECCNSSLRREKTVSDFIEHG